MAHTYTNLLYHITFSTTDRAPLLDEELGARLFPYMGGILRELGGSGLAIRVRRALHLGMRGRALAPRPGLEGEGAVAFPTAGAVGYVLPPLRG